MAILTIPITKGKGSVQFDTDTIPQESYNEALWLGLKELANRGMSKETKAAYNGDEAKLAEGAMKIAAKNVEAINAGEIRLHTKKAKAGESAAVMTEARRLAKNLVKDAIKANGERISDYEPKDITKLANEYLAEDASLVEQAKANLEERAKTPALDKLKTLVSGNLKASPKLIAKNEAAKAKKKAEGKAPGLSAKQAGKVKPRASKPAQATAH